MHAVVRTAATTLLVAAAAALASPRSAAASDWYFPLGEGDTWTYRNERFGGETTIEVLASREARFGVVATVRNWWGENEDRTVVRRRGTVYEITEGRNGGLNLWYRLGAPVGESWTIRVAPPETCIDRSRVSVVSRSETISVPAGTFVECLVLAFQSPCRDAGVTLEAFAPGVGLVKRVTDSIAGPVEHVLVQATVGGRRIPSVPPPQTGLFVSLTLDRFTYIHDRMPTVGDPPPPPAATATLEVRNGTDEEINLHYATGQTYELIVRDETGAIVFRWSDGKFFTQATRDEPLPPGGVLRFTETVDLADFKDGLYTLEFFLVSRPAFGGTSSFQKQTVF